MEEVALGRQLQCKILPLYCFASTNNLFWLKWEHWQIPDGIPHFFKRCAATRDLFDLIVEMCPKTTSAGLAESIERICISMDQTFSAAGKATTTNKSGARFKAFHGGVLSVLNELNEIISWPTFQHFCQTQSNAEIKEILEGLKSRYCKLSVHFPEMAVVDNCCHVHAPCIATFPKIKVVLDVYHFLMRYLGAIVQGMHNPHRSAVARDITNAILKTCAAYDKWATHGVCVQDGTQ
ncbi:hypothetical protein K439DRAFT_1647749 [Ramaria rubella]|nr:hypothetical protein K439DRAFT_1647749 [Ramaria rubella]